MKDIFFTKVLAAPIFLCRFYIVDKIKDVKNKNLVKSNLNLLVKILLTIRNKI